MKEKPSPSKTIIRLSRVPSTNVYAKELLSKIRPEEGTAIVAWSQYDGKGQIGKRWIADDGLNICCSLIYYPTFIPLNRQFLLSQAVSLAVCESLQQQLPECRFSIKWPNDIVADDRKLAGILIENSVGSGGWLDSIIGIGVNINQRIFPHLPHASSFYLLSGREYDCDRIFEKMLEAVQHRYQQLREQPWEQISADYISHLYRKDEWHRFESEGKKWEGMILGVEEDGRLIVRRHEGVSRFRNKEIRFLYPGEE